MSIWAVIGADQAWGIPAGLDQLLETLDRLVCGDRSCHFNCQDLTGELVDDVQVPQPPAGCGLVVLVVDHKDVVLMLGFQPLGISVRGAGPAPLCCFGGYFQAFLSPGPLHSFTVDEEVRLCRDRAGPAVAVAGSLLGECDQPRAEL